MILKEQVFEDELQRLKNELARYKNGVEVAVDRYDFVDIESVVRDMIGDRFRVLVMKEGGDD